MSLLAPRCPLASFLCLLCHSLFLSFLCRVLVVEMSLAPCWPGPRGSLSLLAFYIVDLLFSSCFSYLQSALQLRPHDRTLVLVVMRCSRVGALRGPREDGNKCIFRPDAVTKRLALFLRKGTFFFQSLQGCVVPTVFAAKPAHRSGVFRTNV